MHHHLTRLLLIPAFIFLTLDLPSQTFGDEENLYIPPSLTVGSSYRDRKPMIEVSESRRHDWMVILPAVFFDHPGDWLIPERYQLLASAADTREYADSSGVERGSDQLAKYYQILDIVGNRLQRYAGARLSLRGCYSAEGGESSETAIERARVVREYLTNVWGIDTARLPLLPVARRADTLASNPLQAEARRVEFVGSRPELLGPVRYTWVGFNAFPTMLTALIVPNMEPSLVDSIELMMLDGNGEVQDARAIPGHPDSSRYALNVLWEQKKSKGEEGMTMVARVRSRDGRYRPSNSVFLPVEVNRPEERPLSHTSVTFTLPFLTFGSSGIGSEERRILDRAVDYFHEGITEQEREGYVILARGEVDIAEHPGQNPVEVNVAVATARAEREAAGAEGSGYAWAGRLMIMMPIEENGKMTGAFTSFDSKESYEESARIFRQRQEDEQQRRLDNPALRLADSLAYHRAEAVIAYLRDTLQLPMINDELPDGIGRFQMMMGAMGVEGDELKENVVAATTGMREGILPTGMQGRSVSFLPEQRWYDRGVRLQFWTREYLAMMAQTARRD